MDLVERIVAEVMSQLRNEPVLSDGAIQQDSNGATVISGRVITADVLAEQAKGKTNIQIQTKALLTPSANDWIRQNKIELTRGDAVSARTNQTTVAKLEPSDKPSSNRQTLIIVENGSQVVDAVIDDLSRGSSISKEEATDAENAASLATDKIATGISRVIVITEKTHWVACLANRNDQVRAATVNNVAEVKGVLSVMDGNVFAINGTGRSFFELRNLVRAVDFWGRDKG
jgi:hypothetical protein